MMTAHVIVDNRYLQTHCIILISDTHLSSHQAGGISR